MPHFLISVYFWLISTCFIFVPQITYAEGSKKVNGEYVLSDVLRKQYVDRYYEDAYKSIDKGQFFRARSNLENLIELDPEFPRAYLELARIEMKTNWPQGLKKAERLILIAKSIDNDLADTNILLGYVYTNLKQFKKAEKLYVKAQKVGTKNLWLYANRGLNFQFQGMKKEAILEYKKVLNSKHKSEERNKRPLEWVYARSTLFSMLAELDRTAEADALFDIYAKDFPKNLCVYSSQAKFRLYVMKNSKLALESFRKSHCEKDSYLLAVAHYVDWYHNKNWYLNKKNASSEKAVKVSLRKAQAFSSSDIKLVESLLKSKTTAFLINEIPDLNIDDQNKYGATALSIAVSEQNIENAELLLKAGANPNIEMTELTIRNNPLFIAVTHRNLDMIELLLSYGANVNTVISDGYSIREWMKENGLNGYLKKNDI